MATEMHLSQAMSDNIIGTSLMAASREHEAKARAWEEKQAEAARRLKEAQQREREQRNWNRRGGGVGRKQLDPAPPKACCCVEPNS